jgi:hypothetical protein
MFLKVFSNYKRKIETINVDLMSTKKKFIFSQFYKIIDLFF